MYYMYTSDLVSNFIRDLASNLKTLGFIHNEQKTAERRFFVVCDKIRNMGNESNELNPIESAEGQFGRNVELHAIFMRHGEADEGGGLTETGKRQVEIAGQSIDSADVIKVYSSPIRRARETAEGIGETVTHDKKLETRTKLSLEIPNISEEFLDKLVEIEKRSPDTSTQFYLNFGKQRPDPETSSPQEIAEMMAYVLSNYFKMAKRLKSGSNIDLVNVTHQGLPEALLKEVLIQEDRDKQKVGLETLAEIGGPLKPAESMEFRIRTNEDGDETVELYFRGKTFNLDLGKVDELSRTYIERKVVSNDDAE